MSAQPSRPLSDFWQLLRRDRKLADLFYGRKPIEGLRDQSRSGREMSLVCKLKWYGFDFKQVDAIMRKARIGKWREAGVPYHRASWQSSNQTFPNQKRYKSFCQEENATQC